MNHFIRSIAFALLGGTLALAATCPTPDAGVNILNNSSLACSVSTADSQFNWTVSNLQIVASNANVSSGGVSIGFTTADTATVDHLSVTESVNVAKLGGWSANGTIYIAIDYTLSLNPGAAPEIVSSPDPSTRPSEGRGHHHKLAPNSEIEDFINGQLYATYTDRSVIWGPGKPGSLNALHTGETIYVQQILLINAKDIGSGKFINGFDFIVPQDPSSGGGGNPGPPSEAPEPRSLALIGVGLVGVGCVCRVCRRRPPTTLSVDQLVLIASHNLVQDPRQIVAELPLREV